MTTAQTTERIWRITAMCAVVVVVASFALGGANLALGAFCGGIIAVLNTYGLARIATKVANGELERLAPVGVMMVLKTIFVLSICWILVVRVGIDRLGLALGITSLVVGLFFGATFRPGPSVGSNHLEES